MAVPAKRLSISRVRPQRSASAADIMVASAPLSTKALTGCPLTSRLTCTHQEVDAQRDGGAAVDEGLCQASTEHSVSLLSSWDIEFSPAQGKNKEP
jgi:hypothetical protein